MLGRLVRARGDAAAAKTALAEGLRLVQRLGPRLLMASALEGLAGLRVDAGATESAALPSA